MIALLKLNHEIRKYAYDRPITIRIRKGLTVFETSKHPTGRRCACHVPIAAKSSDIHTVDYCAEFGLDNGFARVGPNA